MAAKKTPAKKAPAKKTAAKKPAPSQAGASASAAAPAAAAERLATAVADQTDGVLEFVRGVVHTSVGIPFVLQSRVSDLPIFEMPKFERPKFHKPSFDLPKFDTSAVTEFLDEAKSEGSARVASFQSRLDVIVDKVEAPLPAPVRETLTDARTRVRKFVAA